MKLRTIAVAVAVLGCLSAAAGGQTPASEFQRSSDYDLLVGDAIDRDARLYQSQSLGAVLVVSDAISMPLLLLPGTGNVQEVPLLRLVPRKSGGVGLLKGDELRTVGKFKITPEAITFSTSLLTGPPKRILHSRTNIQVRGTSFSAPLIKLAAFSVIAPVVIS